MKTFTFKNNLLKFMLLMITAFTTGNLFAQTVYFYAPTATTTTIYAGGSVPFTWTIVAGLLVVLVLIIHGHGLHHPHSE